MPFESSTTFPAEQIIPWEPRTNERIGVGGPQLILIAALELRTRLTRLNVGRFSSKRNAIRSVTTKLSTKVELVRYSGHALSASLPARPNACTWAGVIFLWAYPIRFSVK